MNVEYVVDSKREQETSRRRDLALISCHSLLDSLLRMDTQSSQPIQHPLRPYSVSPQYDDFSWSTSSTSTPPSLRSNSTPTPKDRYSSSLADLDSFSTSAGTISAGTLIKSLVTTSLLSFTGVALVQPFEVGKTLLQVQWVPKDGVLEQIEQQLSPQQLDEDVVRSPLLHSLRVETHSH